MKPRGILAIRPVPTVHLVMAFVAAVVVLRLCLQVF